MEDAGSLDAGLFLDGLRQSGATVCGRGPIALLLQTLGRLEGDEIFQETLDYQTSGELTADFGHSVSYGALGYFRAPSFRLAPNEAVELLTLARDTLARYLRDGTRAEKAPSVTPSLMRRAGVFVTLREQGNLRGCIGTTAADAPLADGLVRMVLAAATEDPRFTPLEPGFTGDLEVEISLLFPMKRIRSRQQHRLHEHGAFFQYEECRSLLLPQVSLHRSWTADQFWSALAHKADLPVTVYDDARMRLHIFRAQVIH